MHFLRFRLRIRFILERPVENDMMQFSFGFGFGVYVKYGLKDFHFNNMMYFYIFFFWHSIYSFSS